WCPTVGRGGPPTGNTMVIPAQAPEVKGFFGREMCYILCPRWRGRSSPSFSCSPPAARGSSRSRRRSFPPRSSTRSASPSSTRSAIRRRASSSARSSSATRTRRTGRARQRLEKVIKDYPRAPVMPEALSLLADVNFSDGRDKEALELLRQVASDYSYTEWGKRAAQRLRQR